MGTQKIGIAAILVIGIVGISSTLFLFLRGEGGIQKAITEGDVVLGSSISSGSGSSQNTSYGTSTSPGTQYSIKTGSGTIHSITILSPTATGVVSLFDATTTAGTPFAIISTRVTSTPFTLTLDRALSSGLAVQTAGQAQEVLISYR